jgi:Ca2+:H+ antiporter
MNLLLKEIAHSKMLWLLLFVPALFAAARLTPEAHTLLFVLSVLAVVPLATLLSHATESVAARTGDTVGGLLNATLGNLTELVIALAALRAGQYMLVKASIAGAIVTNTLFMLGASFLLGGLKHHVQEYNRVGARFQAGLLFLATVALLIPSAVSVADSGGRAAFMQELSLGLSVLLIAAYGLGMLFSLKTHREFFASAESGEAGEAPWPMGLALATLAGVTVLVALVSEIFVESVQEAAVTFGMSPAFVGFIVVALVGGAAEMTSAFSGADGPAILAGCRGDDAHRDVDCFARDQQRAVGMVRGGAGAHGLSDLRHDPVSPAPRRPMNRPLGEGEPGRRSRDADRRAGVQSRLGHHRRGVLSDGLHGRKEPRPDDLSRSAQCRGPVGSATPPRRRAAPGGCGRPATRRD